MLTEQEELFNSIIQKIAEGLDIPPSKYKIAVERYTSIGRFLENDTYRDGVGSPKVYPQGSFCLGTVVRPISEEDDYDIDLVCEFEAYRQNVGCKDLKYMVREKLMTHSDYSRMLEEKEGRRSWKLKYADDSDGIGFHMDILPAVHGDDNLRADLSRRQVPWNYAQYAIEITDKQKETGLYRWSPSNPRGYAKWFDDRKMASYVRIEKQAKQLIFESHPDLYSRIEEVPDAIVKTPLQMAIQILKRHRDMRFSGQTHEQDKPISIIITTLAAKSYANQTDLYTTVIDIVNRLVEYKRLFEAQDSSGGLIEKRSDKWYIPNPVDSEENFADRWHENNNAKAKAFFQWLEWLREDISNTLATEGLHNIAYKLKPSFGERVVKNAFANLGEKYKKERITGVLKMSSGTGILSASGNTPVRDHTFYGSRI